MVCLVAGTLGLAACGQRGALYLPTDPAAADRATLPDLLTPSVPGRGGDATPSSSSSGNGNGSSGKSAAQPAPTTGGAPR